jgi:integrase
MAARKYMLERMPQRHTTAGGYRNNLEKCAIPKWGASALVEVRPLAVDRWFGILPLAQKTKSHVKCAMRQGFEYAMLFLMKAERNPMDFVRVTGATLRDKDPLILTPEQFRTLLQCLVAEPARTQVIVAMCLGLRRSELAGLKWPDFDWQKQEVMIQRSIIAHRVDLSRPSAVRHDCRLTRH